MSALTVTLFVGFLLTLALLVVAVAANDELARENRRLRGMVHPSRRPGQPS